MDSIPINLLKGDNMTLSKNFALETDLICVSEDEYNDKEPYFMDKYEIMNMLADKKRTSIVHKKADNHYILFQHHQYH